MPILDISEFMPSAVATVTSSALHTHAITRGTMPSIPSIVWIRKEMLNPASAKIEVLAQEFFRLLISHQPETRLTHNQVTGVHYILSEEVIGYRNLPEGEADNFANGTYRGLGQVMLVSMVLEEVDLKNGNLGLDNRDRVIKIDGDWCFAAYRIHGKNRYLITPDAILSLPYPSGYYRFNWLDLTIEGADKPTSSIVNPALAQAPKFRSEVNEAMLKICLLPDSFIDKFVDAYMPARGARFANLIKARREQLWFSAIQNPSFQRHLNSAQAAIDTQSILEQMKSFKAGGIQLVSVGERLGLITDVYARAQLLITPPVLAGMLLASIQTSRRIEEVSLQCTTRLMEIKQHVVDADHLLTEYIREKGEQITSNRDNLAKLQAIKANLSRVLASVRSSEVISVKETIERWRVEAVGSLTVGKNAEANNLESALYRIPVDQRTIIISNPGVPNDVQLALARPKLRWRRHNVSNSETRQPEQDDTHPTHVPGSRVYLGR